MPDNPMDLAAKVNVLFHVIMQAVQSYLKNVEFFIYNSYPDKLLVLVDFIINATKICFDRMVFDKRDLLIQQMLRKCSEMKKFLGMNQNSMAKFASIPAKRKTALHSRNSYYFENPYGSKLSMYDMQLRKPTISSSYLRAKSPFDRSVKSRNHSSQSNRSNVSSRSSRLTPSQSSIKNVPPKSRTPMIKKSFSNIKTMVENVKGQESDLEVCKSLPEKPLEDVPANHSNSKEIADIMELLQNVAKEKIQEMLGPLIKQLKSDKSEKLTNIVESAAIDCETDNPRNDSSNKTSEVPSTRVTSEVNKKDLYRDTQERDKVQNVAENVQYIYIKSDDEKIVSRKSSVDHMQPINKNLSELNIKPTSEICASNVKPSMSDENKIRENRFKELKFQAVKDRINVIEAMVENPLYINDHFNEPCKVFAG